jgi:putative SOS response-associated peptidase YedK
MCGRYLRRSDKQRIAEAFPHVKGLEDLVLPPWDYNVAPTTHQPIIREDHEGDCVISLMRWGLVPYFAKDLKAFSYSTINARAESLTTSALFRSPFERRRCLVPADGFYEWKKFPAPTQSAKAVKKKPADTQQPDAFTLTGSESAAKPAKKKPTDPSQPYVFTLAASDDKPFAFAGLWDRWKNPADPAGPPLESFTIITTTPNELTATVHNRMPVILRPQDYHLWLTHPPRHESAKATPPIPPLELLALLRPYPADLMQSHAAHPDVGNVRNNHPGLLNSA